MTELTPRYFIGRSFAKDQNPTIPFMFTFPLTNRFRGRFSSDGNSTT